MTGHLEKHHAEEWGAYCEIRKRIKAEVADVKKEEVESCEMENSEVRFYDVRSSKGRLPFLAKVTQLKESLTKISDDDQGSLEDVWKCYNVFLGVKTFKKDLLASIERRLGEVERLDHFALATALDPRCWSFSESQWVILLTCAGTFSPVSQSLKTGKEQEWFSFRN